MRHAVQGVFGKAETSAHMVVRRGRDQRPGGDHLRRGRAQREDAVHGTVLFCWAMRRFGGEKFALCGKTVSALRRNLLSTLLPALGELGFRYQETVSQNRVRVRFGGQENTFYLFGGRDEGSAGLIQG